VGQGTRPSFEAASPAESARLFFETLVSLMRARYARVASGAFQAHMLVALVNDGPVTLLLDRPKPRGRASVNMRKMTA